MKPSRLDISQPRCKADDLNHAGKSDRAASLLTASLRKNGGDPL
jgi:hypothetical protein